MDFIITTFTTVTTDNTSATASNTKARFLVVFQDEIYHSQHHAQTKPGTSDNSYNFSNAHPVY